MIGKHITHGGFEGHHDFSAQVHILEHALQLVGELTATLCLQLSDHVLLSVSASTAAQQQSLRQILLVERLKHVFALYRQNTMLQPVA